MPQDDVSLLPVDTGGDWGLVRLGVMDPGMAPRPPPKEGVLRAYRPSCLGVLLSHSRELPAAPPAWPQLQRKLFKALPKAMALPGWPISRDLSEWEFKGPTLAILMDPSSSKASSWAWQRHQACVPAGLLCSLLLPPHPPSRVSPKGGQSLSLINSLRVGFPSNPPVTQSRSWGVGTLFRTQTIGLQCSAILV